MEDINKPKKRKRNPVINPGVPKLEPVLVTKAKLEILEGTYRRLINMPMRVDSSKRSVDDRIKLLLNMRETYLDLFTYLRKFYPGIIAEYSNMLAVKAKGKDRFKEGYVSW